MKTQFRLKFPDTTKTLVEEMEEELAATTALEGESYAWGEYDLADNTDFNVKNVEMTYRFGLYNNGNINTKVWNLRMKTPLKVSDKKVNFL